MNNEIPQKSRTNDKRLQRNNSLFLKDTVIFDDSNGI